MDDFPNSEWIEKEDYYININLQGTQGWLDARKERLTGSNVGTAMGISSFKTPKDLALHMLDITPFEFTEKAKEVMAHGNKEEPNARKYYEEVENVKVEEYGLVVPKWNHRLGASVDGVVVGTDGIIEIKCPKQMYLKLVEKIETDAKPREGRPRNDYRHIWPTHYAQMQFCMLCLGKKWCDYIVYATETENVYIERIPFSTKYCNEYLFPGVDKFFLLMDKIKKENNIK